MSGFLIDETKHRYGKLVVVKRVKNSLQGNVRWFCKCDCGGYKTVRGIHLRSGSIQFCGCSHKFPIGQAALHAVFLRSRNSAKKRGYTFKLTEGVFASLSQENCFYCGSPPSAIAKQPGCNGHGIYNGIDRIDNTRGYIEDNCVPCCWICNRAKGALTVNDFITWIKRVSVFPVKGGSCVV